MIKNGYGVIQIVYDDIIFDKLSLKQAALQYETPFFLMSEKQIEDNYKNFLSAFLDIKNFHVFYSVKTNFESEVLKALQRLGSGAEISGGQDFFVAKKAGFLGEKIIFDGPCKKEEELVEAIDSRIHCINAESIEELGQIERISEQKNVRTAVGIRIDPLVDNNYYDAVIDTYKRKFGYPINEVLEIFLKAKHFSHLDIVAIHAHIGSQLLDVSMYTRALDKIFRLICELKRHGIEIKDLNIGGGFPAQSMRNIKISKRIIAAQLLEKMGFNLEKKIPTIFDFGQAITEAYNRNAKKFDIRPSLITEPGRCIVSNIAALVGKVVAKKRNWIFTDISVNEVSENMFFADRDFGFPGKMNAKIETLANISGPTLATADVLYLKEKVPAVNVGDALVIFDVGAYSIPRSIQFTQPRKAVYYIPKEGQVKTIRTRETYEDVIKNQVW